MGLERYPDEQIGQSKYIDPIADYQMNVNDHVVRPFSSGAMPHVRLATNAALGTVVVTGSGVGKTLTQDTSAVEPIDGVAPVVGDLIMVKDQADSVDNGIYIITLVGDGGTVDQTLVRATEYDATSDFALGDLFYATEGTANGGLIGHVSTLPAVLDTNDIEFTLGIYEGITITLPSVSKAMGKFYSIVARSGSATNLLPVTVTDGGDSEGWIGDMILAAPGEKVLLYSDGLTWEHKNYNLALDAASGTTVEPIYVTLQCVDGWNFGRHATYTTAACMDDAIFIGDVCKVIINHVAYETYVSWNILEVNVDQTAGTAYQYIASFSVVNFIAGDHNLQAEGGAYGVLGVAQCGDAVTLDQPLIAGYFDCDPGSDIAGTCCAIRGRMQHYTDYGLDILNVTNHGTAGIRLFADQTTTLPIGIMFEIDTAGEDYIEHSFGWADANMNDGAYVASSSIANYETADGLIKIVCNETDYYIPFYNADAVGSDWSDQG